MENCYDCNHCEVCRWIDKFKNKGVCDFYENGIPLDKIRDEIIQERESNTYGEYDKIFELCLLIIDKYRKKSEG